MRHPIPLFLILSLPLAACQLTARPENGSSSLPPAMSRLVLKQELTIPAGTAHVTVQGGRIVSGDDINRYHPHCKLEVQKVSDRPQRVGPDEFVIRRAYRETQSAGRGGLRHVAGRVGFSSDGSPTFLVYRTVFVLSSERQPQVRWMACEQWSDPTTGRDVTLQEIRTALGGVFTLALPAGGTDGA